jgi:hypothetical protein
MYVYVGEAARKAAEETEAEAKAEKLAWISDHASKHLRRLVAEGIRWGKVYRDERLALERPGWAWEYYGDVEVEDARGSSVTEEHLRRLDEARAVEPNAQLRQVEQRLVLWAEDYLGYPILREMG